MDREGVVTPGEYCCRERRLVENLCVLECEGGKGRAIRAKTYAFDAMDNLERCLTRFADGSEDTAKFSYANDDSFQLTKVTHTLLEDYPATQAFTYDLRGNRLNDEQGRPLEYDLRGRLERVRETDGSERVRYLYDGHDQLLASVHGGGARKVQRRYQDHRLEATREGSLLTQYLLGETHALAVQRSDAPTEANNPVPYLTGDQLGIPEDSPNKWMFTRRRQDRYDYIRSATWRARMAYAVLG